MYTLKRECHTFVTLAVAFIDNVRPVAFVEEYQIHLKTKITQTTVKQKHSHVCSGFPVVRVYFQSSQPSLSPSVNTRTETVLQLQYSLTTRTWLTHWPIMLDLYMSWLGQCFPSTALQQWWLGIIFDMVSYYIFNSTLRYHFQLLYRAHH